MANEIDFDEIFRKYRSDPFEYIDIRAIHTGLVRCLVAKDSDVAGPSGEWMHVPGTGLYEITRERNTKLVTSQTNGTVADINAGLDGKFVEAGEKLMTIRHPLKKKRSLKIS